MFQVSGAMRPQRCTRTHVLVGLQIFDRHSWAGSLTFQPGAGDARRASRLEGRCRPKSSQELRTKPQPHPRRELTPAELTKRRAYGSGTVVHPMFKDGVDWWEVGSSAPRSKPPEEPELYAMKNTRTVSTGAGQVSCGSNRGGQWEWRWPVPVDHVHLTWGRPQAPRCLMLASSLALLTSAHPAGSSGLEGTTTLGTVNLSLRIRRL
jgi:hypothetical protein